MEAEALANWVLGLLLTAETLNPTVDPTLEVHGT